MGMVRRRTRRRTMMVAGGMAYERGRHASEEEAVESQPVYAEAPPVPPAPPPPAPSVEDPTAEIQNLASLHDSGALSDEEFSAAKKKILGI